MSSEQRPPSAYRPDLRPMAILVALLAAVVIGWVLLGPLILPAGRPAASADALAGRWTATPEAPRSTSLVIADGRYEIDGDLPYAGSGAAAVEGPVLVLHDDPNCPGIEGRYEFRLEPIDRYGLLPQHQSEALTLVVLSDACADGARSRTLAGEWILRSSGREGVYGICDPPNEEAAITGHWPEPTGCS